MANSISVAVGDIDTIRVGRWSRVSLPAGVSRVTGNAAPWAAGAAASDLAPSWPQPAATRAMASSRTRGRRGLLIHPPLGRRMRGSWGSEAQPALPPRTELAATEAGGLARPRRGRRGLTVAGQRRVRTGLRWSPWRPAAAPGAPSIWQTPHMSGATRRTLDAILDAMLDAFPSSGRDLGLRGYEGRVDDLSPAGLARRGAERRRHLATLAELAAADGQEAADRDHLALVLAEEELLLGRREQARRDPLWAGRVLQVTSYLDGPPGMAAERAEGLRRHLEQVPDALDGLAAGLEEVPAAFREAAADVFPGYASFYRTGAAALAGAEVAERAAAAVERYAAVVAATDGPPLEPWGPADFAELLRVRTGTALDPAGLLARGRAEAGRQLAG